MSRRDRVGVDPAAQQGLGARAPDAEDQPVGTERVLDGKPLAEELRVPGQLDIGAGELVQGGLQPLGGADGDGRLADHERRAALSGQKGGQPDDRVVHVAQVGGVAAPALRGPHTEEVHLGPRRLGQVGGEAQPTRLDVLAQQRFEPGLVERGLAALQGGDLRGVDVDADDLEAEVGHSRRMDGTEVAGANDRNTHVLFLPSR